MESKAISVLLIIIHCSLKEYKQTRGCKIAQTNLCRPLNCKNRERLLENINVFIDVQPDIKYIDLKPKSHEEVLAKLNISDLYEKK